MRRVSVAHPTPHKQTMLHARTNRRCCTRATQTSWALLADAARNVTVPSDSRARDDIAATGAAGDCFCMTLQLRWLRASATLLVGCVSVVACASDRRLAQLERRVDSLAVTLTAVTNRLTSAARPAGRDTATVSMGSGPVAGDPAARVVIVEFTDYQCPFCERHFETTPPRLRQAYVATGKARWSCSYDTCWDRPDWDGNACCIERTTNIGDAQPEPNCTTPPEACTASYALDPGLQAYWEDDTWYCPVSFDCCAAGSGDPHYFYGDENQPNPNCSSDGFCSYPPQPTQPSEP